MSVALRANNDRRVLRKLRVRRRKRCTLLWPGEREGRREGEKEIEGERRLLNRSQRTEGQRVLSPAFCLQAVNRQLI